MDDFHPELVALLDDPITGYVMASDKVDMVSLLTLLRTARRRLRETAAATMPASSPCCGPVI